MFNIGTFKNVQYVQETYYGREKISLELYVTADVKCWKAGPKEQVAPE